MTVRCKFECRSKTHHGHKDHEGNKQITAVSVELIPVYSSDPDAENKAFWDATPSGKLEMYINNVPAGDAFEVGAQYYIDITKAEA